MAPRVVECGEEGSGGEGRPQGRLVKLRAGKRLRPDPFAGLVLHGGVADGCCIGVSAARSERRGAGRQADPSPPVERLGRLGQVYAQVPALALGHRGSGTGTIYV